MLKKFLCIGVVILLVGVRQINESAGEEISDHVLIEELQVKIKLLEAQIKKLEKEKEETLKKYNTMYGR